jgi:hypothetical protein
MPVAGKTTHVRRLTTLSMARFRSKSCPEATTLVVEGAGEECGYAAGERKLPRYARTPPQAGVGSKTRSALVALLKNDDDR